MQSLSFGFKFKQPLYLAGTMLLAGMTLAGCGGKSDIAAGGAHTVVYQQGQLYTWGRNTNNQLGNGETGVNSKVPVAINLPLPPGVEVADIKANLNFTLLLDTAGDVWAWGRNREGTLANGTTEPVSKPLKIAALDEIFVVDIGAGQRHGLAVTRGGKVWAWGNNSKGQLGFKPNADVSPAQDNVPQPRLVSGLSDIKDAEGGGAFNLAIDSQGQLYTWGDNDNGQLGVNPEEVSSRYEPELIEGLEQAVTAIAAGKDHAVVLLQDGSMRAWGLNRSGQLGIGTQENAYQPAMVNTSALMKSISASGNFNLAISTDQKLYSWGQNLAGSLGTGRADNESAPVLVDAFSQPVINAVNGLGHSIVTTVEEDGSKAFWTFGLNSFGQIGVADAPFRNLTPLRIVFSSQEK